MNMQIQKRTDSISSQGYIKTLEIKVSGTPKEVDDYYEKMIALALPEEPSFCQKVSNHVLRFINLWR